MEANIVLAFVVGIVVLCLIGKVVSLPMRILWKLVSNSIVGDQRSAGGGHTIDRRVCVHRFARH